MFVSQTPDYILPATSCIIQEQFVLPESCYMLDISLGCSGWVYGMSVVSSLLQSGCMKRALLLAGDTIFKFCSYEDQSTYPLFGDAGTGTALEFDTNSEGLKFSFNSDGKGKEAIIIRDGDIVIPRRLIHLRREKNSKNIACSFGVGLLRGSVYFETDKICIPQLIEI